MTRAEAGLLVALAALGAFVGVQAAGVHGHRAAPAASSALDTVAVAGTSGADVRVETRESVLPPPRRDTAQVRRLLLAGAGATYIDDILSEHDSTLARWPDRRADPVRVWVQQASSAEGWRPEYTEDASDAFRRWETVGLPVRFAFVADSAGAEVRVRFVDRLTMDTRIGSTRRVHDQSWWVVDGEITLATHTVDGRLLDPETIRTSTLHEVGHLLGLGHTSDTTAVMAPRAYGATALTPRDEATVRLLYELPPGRVW